MYTFFHYENDGEKCLPPKMKSQWLFKMSHFHIEHPVYYKPGTESSPATNINVGSSKGNFSPGVMQKSWINPKGSTPSTGESKINPLMSKHPCFK